jgi:hypothetical protein
VKRFVLLIVLTALTLNASDLLEKVRDFMGDDRYATHRGFIEILFKDEAAYYTNEHLDVVKIVETLKQNGLLQLFFEKPQQLTLTFTTNGPSLYFVKVMGDTLHAIGYYRYMTEYSKKNESEFVWRITMQSEYATDPTVLKNELFKRGCKILDIKRLSQSDWYYNIDMASASLNAHNIGQGEVLKLKRSLVPHWVNVEGIRQLKLTSSGSNVWYPYITFFDNSLHLLKVYKRDKKTWQIRINIPSNTQYVKIADMYDLKNIKDGLDIEASGIK